MTQRSKREYIEVVRKRYAKSDKPSKKRFRSRPNSGMRGGLIFWRPIRWPTVVLQWPESMSSRSIWSISQLGGSKTGRFGAKRKKTRWRPLLYEYFHQRKEPVRFTRSWEYHKNDNAHIASKNWSLIRQYLGCERFGDIQIAALLNDLYQNEWRPLINGFIPSFKLAELDGIAKVTNMLTFCTKRKKVAQKEKNDNYFGNTSL